MRIYAFDLLPWPYLDEPSIYPDSNRLFDPSKGHELYQQHLDQIAFVEDCRFDAICFAVVALLWDYSNSGACRTTSR